MAHTGRVAACMRKKKLLNILFLKNYIYLLVEESFVSGEITMPQNIAQCSVSVYGGGDARQCRGDGEAKRGRAIDSR